MPSSSLIPLLKVMYTTAVPMPAPTDLAVENCQNQKLECSLGLDSQPANHEIQRKQDLAAWWHIESVELP